MGKHPSVQKPYCLSAKSQPDQLINLASKSKLDVGNNLRSCTEEVQASKPFTADGRSVVLVDTPGFHDTFKSDTDVLDSIAQSLAERRVTHIQHNAAVDPKRPSPGTSEGKASVG